GIEGLKDGESLGRQAVDNHEIRVHAARGAPQLTVNEQTLGTPVRDGDDYLWYLPNLADGTYHVTVTADRLLFGTASRSLSFTVASKVPTGTGPAGAPAAAIDQPLTIEGAIDEKATVTADGSSGVVMTTTPDGAHTFKLQFPFPPAAPITINAVDAAGNATK